MKHYEKYDVFSFTENVTYAIWLAKEFIMKIIIKRIWDIPYSKDKYWIKLNANIIH